MTSSGIIKSNSNYLFLFLSLHTKKLNFCKTELKYNTAECMEALLH